MDTIYINSNNIEELTKAFNNCEKNNNIKSFMLLMADTNHYKVSELEPLLKASSKKIIGGIFPEIIFNGARKKEGLIIIPSDETLKIATFNLDQTNEEVTDVLMQQFGEMSEISGTLMVYVDGLGSNKNAFLESIFNFFGGNVHYLGAGTGSLKFHSFPNIIGNNGLFENAGIIGHYPHKVDIGVAHGWEPISKPLKLTKTDGKKIISINWEPAFEVYKKIVEQHSNLKFEDSTFLDLAKSYPIGIAVIDSEMLIRDPYAVEDNSILLLDSIEEGAYVNIMHGNMELLLDGAETARKKAFSNKNEKKKVFCIDCISRVLYMNEDFDKELTIIQKEGKVNGALSLGEIANIGESFLECYNKTVVVAKW